LAGHIAHMDEKINIKRFCGANVKGPPGRTRFRWENNTEMELKEIRWNGVNWIQLAPYRDKSRDLVKRVLKFCVPSNRVY